MIQNTTTSHLRGDNLTVVDDWFVSIEGYLRHMVGTGGVYNEHYHRKVIQMQ